jgi:ABC-type antimicrobial peptide transport system permease subunit
MRGKLGFYLTHSLNDLRVNGQRTLFALLCIAAGVAAIVSLQTLGVTIRSTLTSSLQEINQGDIQIEPLLETFQADDDAFENVAVDGLVTPGTSFSVDHFSDEGLARLQAWADENFPGQVTATYSNNIGLMGIAGITSMEQNTTLAFIVANMIDPEQYPYYGRVLLQDGTTLSEAMQNPTDIVLDNSVAERLGVEIGDPVLVQGSTTEFTVVGIVAETTGGFEQIFNALFGSYYLPIEALPFFPGRTTEATSVYWRLADPSLTQAVGDALTRDYPYLTVTTTLDLQEENAQISDAVIQLVSIMGLLSMLIGGIGIINTMQVIVRRRTTEVAVLKTIGLQANQVTTLFLVEAFLMGVIGSVIGVLIGWALTFVLQGAAEGFLNQDLQVQITPEPALTGLIVGVLVTTVFGFLPTLSAGQIRPGLVLRPTDTVIPRAGCLGTLLSLLVVVVVLTLIAGTFIGTIAAGVVPGAFLAVGILWVLLFVVIWLLGRFFPSFGIIDLKIALRSMLAARRRGATTLLALAVGVFVLSVITLLTGTLLGLFGDLLENQTGGNLIAFAPAGDDTLSQVEAALDETPGVISYAAVANYDVLLVSVEDGATGQVQTRAELIEQLNAIGFSGPAATFAPDEFQAGDLLDTTFQSLESRDVDSNLPEAEFEAGRQLAPEDAGQPVMVLTASDTITNAGIEVGDRITFAFTSARQAQLGVSSPDDVPQVTLEVVGVRADSGLAFGGGGAGVYAPSDVFPADVLPGSVSAVIETEDDQVSSVQRALQGVPGIFVLETRLLNDLVNRLVDQFTGFPIVVAALSLVVGGVVIANSVALTTLERRREIAVMKAVGLQRERVLGMLLIENALMGLVGGLIGVGIGLVILVLIVGTGFPEGSLASVPYGTAFLLMLLCAGIALLAAVLTAWGASGEKPLNVLRYE